MKSSKLHEILNKVSCRTCISVPVLRLKHFASTCRLEINGLLLEIEDNHIILIIYIPMTTYTQ